MRSVAVLVALAAAACASVSRPPARMEDSAASLAAAETAFAAHSVRDDMRVAFLAAFAADGVFVRDGWTVARDFLQDRPAPPIVLDWRPAYTEVGRSGEMGLSTGPWKLTSKTKPDEPASYGQFVSIWKRAPGGPWRVAVDLGIAHPQPAFWNSRVEAVTPRGTASTPDESLLDAEKRFALMAREKGLTAAYEDNAASNLRFYRGGSQPSVGLQALRLAAPSEAVAWTIARSETATSNDFGYARGSYAAASAPGRTLGYFLRVWRVEQGRWRIVLDVTNPART